MVEIKKCNSCQIIKNINDFGKASKNKDGKKNRCKDCEREIRRKYYIKNKKQILEKNKEYKEKHMEQIAKYQKEYKLDNRGRLAEKDNKYYIDNKESRRNYQRKYYKNNEEKVKNYQKYYREKNLKQVSEYQKWYYENNKDQIKEYKREYQENNKEKISKYKRDKYNKNIKYKLTSLLRSRIRLALKNKNKCGSAINDLGCPIWFFKKYLEGKFKNGMNWDNYGTVWHIDHIIPLFAFNLEDTIQFKAACYYKNLQPLFVDENLSKGEKYNKSDYDKYINYFKSII